MKKLSLLTLGFVLFSFGISFVKAETITYKKLDNIYFNMTVDGEYSSNGVTMFDLDGRLAYCIEPGVAINTKTYDSTSDWSKTSLTKEQQQYLEKVGYYGYEYPGHQTDKYYIATQELIWKGVKNIDAYFTTGPNGTGNKIDLTKEKNEILSLIKKHESLPSFTNSTIEGEVSSNITVKDKNNVLEDFNISSNNIHQIERDKNNLKITFNDDVKEEKITLSRKAYDNKLLLVYTKGSSQKLASLRLSTPENYYFTIKSKAAPKEEPKKEIIKEVKVVKEIVKVPSTGEENRIKHFNITKILKNDFNYFN